MTTITFPGSSLDTSTWFTYSGAGGAGPGIYDPARITVAGGVCSLAGTKADGHQGGMGMKLPLLYGTVTVHARMDAGTGWSPAIGLWPQDQNWPTEDEVDVIEMPEGARTTAHSTLHYGAGNSQIAGTLAFDGTLWHTYGIIWTPTSIVCQVDGVTTVSSTNPAVVPNTAHYLFLQVNEGVIPSWVPAPDGTTPASVALQVDQVTYVQAARTADIGGQHNRRVS